MTPITLLEGVLDGTRATWRPALKLAASDDEGDPVAWSELVVVACPKCGAQTGVGGRGSVIKADGTTASIFQCGASRAVKAPGWKRGDPVPVTTCDFADSLEFLGWTGSSGREAFEKIKSEATAEVDKLKDARIAAAAKARLEAELVAKVAAEVSAAATARKAKAVNATENPGR